MAARRSTTLQPQRLARAVRDRVARDGGRELVERAERMFGVLSALLPGRIARDELADALEDVRRREAEGRPTLEIRLKIVATIFWVSLRGFEHLAIRIGRVITKSIGLADLFKVFKR